MRRIASLHDVQEGLAYLVAADPRLAAVADLAGPLPLRRRSGGFEGLASIVTAQQISESAAASIWSRLRAAVDPFTPDAFQDCHEDRLREAGLSRPKIRTLVNVAAACRSGLDWDSLGILPADEALATLQSINGIGPWTAEIYLLFCVGHPDIFPAGDLALQVAAQHGLALHQRPGPKVLRLEAERWSPWRGVAARLLWGYYRVLQDSRRTRP